MTYTISIKTVGDLIKAVEKISDIVVDKDQLVKIESRELRITKDDFMVVIKNETP